MSKHTPGPWIQSENIFYMINGYDGEGVTELRTTYRTKPEAQANARLIACAPDMLFLIKRMREMINTPANFHPDAYEEMYGDVEKLLAKITGGDE